MLWKEITEAYAPWVQPLNNDGLILSPWIDSDVTIATDMVAIFVESIEFLVLQFQGKDINIFYYSIWFTHGWKR